MADWIRNHSERFGIASIACKTNLSHHDWTVDNDEDYALVSAIFDALYRSGEVFALESVLQFLNRPIGRDLSSSRGRRPRMMSDHVNILGIFMEGPNTGACLLCDGELIAIAARAMAESG